MIIKYYTEVNLICAICLVILIAFTNRSRSQSGQLSSDGRIIKLLLWTTVIMCISDMAAGILRGQFFPGARALIEFSNILYFEAVSVIGYLWTVYVFAKLGIIRNYQSWLLLWTVPLILISVATCLNPLTNWMFVVDENNLYVRNAGVYFHWSVSLVYLIAATVVTALKMSHETVKEKRREMMPLLTFIIAPVVAAVLQMLFYSVTCLQVGITISLLVAYLNEQNNQIVTDAVTGLSNRYGFNRYWESYVQHRGETRLVVMMIDLDNFKQVNDQFSHLEGDRALADVADVIKRSCDESPCKWFTCRYGGDEFILAGCDCEPEQVTELSHRIRQKLDEKNRNMQYPYELSVSIGIASGVFSDAGDMEHLLRVADEAMYEEKKRAKGLKVLPAARR